MPSDTSAGDAAHKLEKVEQKLAVAYVALMFCAAVIVGGIIHTLNLPALCR